MARTRRLTPPGIIQHVLNRGVGRRTLFATSDHYMAFLGLMREYLEQYPVAILAYCLMPNHWHLVVRPSTDRSLSAYLHRVCTRHALRTHFYASTIGAGHIYQNRFKNFPIHGERHLLAVLRYVESNPVRSKLVSRAEHWPWSSLAARASGDAMKILSPWPVPQPRDWCSHVNVDTPSRELGSIRRAVRSSSGFGTPPPLTSAQGQYRQESG